MRRINNASQGINKADNALTMHPDALTRQADTLTMHPDALALQDIAKFNSLRINEMLYLARYKTIRLG
ncbi:hypothetical protein [Nostoc sp.]|uniref:hypothetical protein n=1 Tax=Nostoc sp. TaxID=1180 RepID=UPI002FF1CA94